MEIDLFDYLNDDEQPAGRHMILPNFLTACGRECREVLKEGKIAGRVAHTFTSSKTTCQECIEAGEAQGGLSVLCERISSRQADVID